MSDGHYLHVLDTRTRQTYQLPIYRNTIRGSDLARIQAPPEECHATESMYNHTGLRLFDPGFENVAAMESSITFTDGHANPPALEYRGYTFSELGRTCDFEDMTYLMIWGHKPSPEEKLTLRRRLGQACLNVPPVVVNVIQSFPRSTPFYPMLLAGLAAYIGAYPTAIPAVAGRNLYQGKMDSSDEAIVQSLAAYAVVLAIAYCHRQELEFQPADPEAPFLNNIFRFLHLGADPAVIAFIGHIWVQGCDHEMNNSAAALLHAASALADPLSCVMSALTSSYGLRHFGAADSIYRVMKDIGSPKNVATFLAAAKARGERIPGVGHRVYKSSKDPRTEPMKKLLQGLKEKGLEDPLVEIAYEIERQVTVDPYFLERHLHVNIDLYWPFGYTALGIPSDAVLPLFLASRMVGLMAHWREAMNQQMKMWRPQQLFVGERAQTKARAAAAAAASNSTATNAITQRVPEGDEPQHNEKTDGHYSEEQPDQKNLDQNENQGGYDFTGIKTVASQLLDR